MVGSAFFKWTSRPILDDVMKDRFNRIRNLRSAYEQKKAMTEIRLVRANSELQALSNNIDEIKVQLSQPSEMQFHFHDLTMKYLVALTVLKEKMAIEVDSLKVRLLKDQMSVLASAKIENRIKNDIDVQVLVAQLQETLENINFQK